MNQNHLTRLFTSNRASGNETVRHPVSVTCFTEVVWRGRAGSGISEPLALICKVCFVFNLLPTLMEETREWHLTVVR